MSRSTRAIRCSLVMYDTIRYDDTIRHDEVAYGVKKCRY